MVASKNMGWIRIPPVSLRNTGKITYLPSLNFLLYTRVIIILIIPTY